MEVEVDKERDKHRRLGHNSGSDNLVDGVP